MDSHVGEDWLTVAECAKRLRRHPKTIHVYIGRGLLRASQMVPRGNVLVERRSMEDMLYRRMNRPVRS